MHDSIALVFPGQGSQKLGMLSNFYQAFPVFRQIFDESRGVLGYDLWQLISTGPETVLNQTEYTQPALLVSGYALFQVWKSKNLHEPIVMAGHSLGEYTALLCSGVLSFSEALKLVSLRGRLMQSAVKEGKGSMAAVIGLTDQEVIEICDEASTEHNQVFPANFNAPIQIVIAGHSEAVQKAMLLAKEKGAKRAILLPVSVPAHCPLMQPAVEEFKKTLELIDWKKGKVPVLHNVDVSSRDNRIELCSILLEQLYRPVQWVKTVLTMKEKYGVKKIIECGPGGVLTGLNRRVDVSLECVSIDEHLETIGL